MQNKPSNNLDKLQDISENISAFYRRDTSRRKIAGFSCFQGNLTKSRPYNLVEQLLLNRDGTNKVGGGRKYGQDEVRVLK